jgi:DNA mismatch repair protein MutS
MAETQALPDTPVMRQYQELKSRHPESLLFFRLGDFYEMFASDAETAAPILGLILTARQSVPMCGVPIHSAERYIAKLLRQGHKVAIAEQMETASAAKKLVRRDIIRIVTPGTIVEEDLLEPGSANFLAGVVVDVVGWGAAFLDVSTGEFWSCQTLNDPSLGRLIDKLSRARPSEIVASKETLAKIKEAWLSKACLTPFEPPSSGIEPAWVSETLWQNQPLARRAALLCRSYVSKTKISLRELPVPRFKESGADMHVDETAARTLDLIESASGEKRHTLWGFLDHCKTAMGSRKLKTWILRPSTDLAEIITRQNAVAGLREATDRRYSLGKALGDFRDLARVASRLSTQRAGPKDLGALRASLSALENLKNALVFAAPESRLADLRTELSEAETKLTPLLNSLKAALSDELPATLSEGGLIRRGYNAELDELRGLKTDSQGHLSALETAERKATGINSLKAGYNSVFGYYLEITKTHSAKAPARYIRKQTLTNAERYITPELKELEDKILGSQERVIRLEATLFEDLREQALRHYDLLIRLSELVSETDVLLSLAEAALLHELIRPTVDRSHELNIEGGRHPVIESLVPTGQFVPNSLKLDSNDNQILVLTGPNMAGKSTYLRQNALIVLMAQIGSFVPAESARIGIVDKILTRIGAQDAIARGDSTFMVEMKETSQILKSATTRSLIILDEVGRGTSTFDGISIAWAVLEHLHSAFKSPEATEAEPRGPRVLFATHYFELTELAPKMSGVKNANVAVREWTNPAGQHELVFLHKIEDGPADRSYGIHVAALAAIPAPVLVRAQEILARLENGPTMGRIFKGPELNAAPELPMFEANPVLQTLKMLNVDKMTPLEALNALVELKKKI